MNKFKTISLAASTMLALAFTSCSSDEGEEEDGPVTYEGQTYQTVKIGTQTWFAENLNYNASGSKCYGEDGGVITDWDDDFNPITKTLTPSQVQTNCTKYGRLYDWQTAKTACPAGWHLPSNDDWDKLFKYVDAENGGNGEGTPYSSMTAGKHLKTTSGWYSTSYYNGNGTNKYGFSAQPGGYRDLDGNFSITGYDGVWWSSSEGDSGNAYRRLMMNGGEGAMSSSVNNLYLYSVRCVKD